MKQKHHIPFNIHWIDLPLTIITLLKAMVYLTMIVGVIIAHYLKEYEDTIIITNNYIHIKEIKSHYINIKDLIITTPNIETTENMSFDIATIHNIIKKLEKPLIALGADKITVSSLELKNIPFNQSEEISYNIIKTINYILRNLQIRNNTFIDLDLNNFTYNGIIIWDKLSFNTETKALRFENKTIFPQPLTTIVNFTPNNELTIELQLNDIYNKIDVPIKIKTTHNFLHQQNFNIEVKWDKIGYMNGTIQEVAGGLVLTPQTVEHYFTNPLNTNISHTKINELLFQYLSNLQFYYDTDKIENIKNNKINFFINTELAQIEIKTKEPIALSKENNINMTINIEDNAIITSKIDLEAIIPLSISNNDYDIKIVSYDTKLNTINFDTEVITNIKHNKKEQNIKVKVKNNQIENNQIKGNILDIVFETKPHQYNFNDIKATINKLKINNTDYINKQEVIEIKNAKKEVILKTQYGEFNLNKENNIISTQLKYKDIILLNKKLELNLPLEDITKKLKTLKTNIVPLSEIKWNKLIEESQFIEVYFDMEQKTIQWKINKEITNKIEIEGKHTYHYNINNKEEIKVDNTIAIFVEEEKNNNNNKNEEKIENITNLKIKNIVSNFSVTINPKTLETYLDEKTLKVIIDTTLTQLVIEEVNIEKKDDKTYQIFFIEKNNHLKVETKIDNQEHIELKVSMINKEEKKFNFEIENIGKINFNINENPSNTTINFTNNYNNTNQIKIEGNIEIIIQSCNILTTQNIINKLKTKLQSNANNTNDIVLDININIIYDFTQTKQQCNLIIEDKNVQTSFKGFNINYKSQTKKIVGKIEIEKGEIEYKNKIYQLLNSYIDIIDNKKIININAIHHYKKLNNEDINIDINIFGNVDNTIFVNVSSTPTRTEQTILNYLIFDNTETLDEEENTQENGGNIISNEIINLSVKQVKQFFNLPVDKISVKLDSKNATNNTSTSTYKVEKKLTKDVKVSYTQSQENNTISTNKDTIENKEVEVSYKINKNFKALGYTNESSQGIMLEWSKEY